MYTYNWLGKTLSLGAHSVLSYFSSPSFPLQLLLSLASTNSPWVFQDAMVSLSVSVLIPFTPWGHRSLRRSLHRSLSYNFLSSCCQLTPVVVSLMLQYLFYTNFMICPPININNFTSFERVTVK